MEARIRGPITGPSVGSSAYNACALPLSALVNISLMLAPLNVGPADSHAPDAKGRIDNAMVFDDVAHAIFRIVKIRKLIT